MRVLRQRLGGRHGSFSGGIIHRGQGKDGHVLGGELARSLARSRLPVKRQILAPSEIFSLARARARP